MATKVDELEVLIKANTSELKAGLDKTQSQIASFSKGISAKAVAIGGIVSASLIKAFQAVSSEMDAAISRLDTLNNFPRVMSNLGIETQLSSQAINKLSDDLRGLPTSLSDAVSAVQRLTAVNSNLAYSTDAFLALNNAILAGGAPAQMQATAIEQISQAYSKGKPDMMEWRAIMSTMPAQLNQIAMAMGTNSTALGEGLRNGTISMNDFMNTIMKLNKEGVAGFQSFTEQAKNSTGGVATAITNLRISIQRAVADIMNVIGQANISGFINGIASAIGTAANYIAAFVKLLKQAFAWIHALFGGGSGSTTKVIQQTSDGIDGVASSVGGVTDNLDDATGSAKKLKKQLAGFDEMNVWQESAQSGGGSGSSNASGGGGISVGDYSWDTAIDESTSKVEKAFERLKKYLDSFGFDFDKIGGAVKKFRDDVEAFLEPVKQIFSDVWKEIKPFITWAGNELLPAFLNAFGGALQFVGGVLKTVWNSLIKPFYENFLKPIAVWTGGKIVDILNKLGDTLRNLGQNDKVLERIATGIKMITAAITAFKIANFVDGITKAVGVFKEVYATGATVRTALGAVASESTGLTSVLAYGGSSLLSAFESVKGVVSGFFATLQAHPIVAVIGVLAMLIMTNDDLRESFFQIIQTALKPIISIFQSLWKCVEPIIDIIIELIEIAITPLETIIKVVADILNVVFTILEPFLNLFMEIATALNPINILLKILSPLLELIAKLLEPVAEGLELVGELITGLTSIISGSITSMFNMGASMEDLKKSEENLKKSGEEYNDILKERNDIQKSMSDSLKSLDEAEKKYKETVDALREAEKASGSQIQLTSEDLRELEGELFDTTSKEERLKIVADRYGLSMETNRDQVDNLYEAILDENSALSDLETKQDKQKEQNKSLGESNKKLQGNLDGTIAELKKTGLNTEQLNTLLANLDKDGSAHSKALKDAIIKNAGEFGSAWDEKSGKMVKQSDVMWQQMQSKCGESFEKMKSWASGAAEKVKNAFSNLGQKFQEIGSNIWNGLKNGIGDIAGKMSNMFGSAISSVKNMLGIASPSKVFARLGAYVSEGFANGILDESDKVQSAFEEISQFTVPDLGLNSDMNIGMSEELQDLTENQQPINLLLKIDSESIPISASRITNTLNDQTFLNNQNLLTI